jgi:hypothetical protein
LDRGQGEADDENPDQQDLNFDYTLPWLEGIRRMAAWFEAHGGLPNSDNDTFEDRLVAAWYRLGKQLRDALRS